MSIDTLISDIYKLAEGAKAPSPNGDYTVSASYAKWFDKQERVREDKVLYFSEVGDPCSRKLWYKYNKPELATAIDGNLRIKFFYGDMLENLVLDLVRSAGHEVSGEQQRVIYDAGGGWVVRGYIDAIIDGVPVDVKSVTKFSEEKFKNNLKDDPFGYYQQLCGYATTLNAPNAGFLTIQKELGHINYYPIEVNPGLFKLQAANAIEVVQEKEVTTLPQLNAVPQSATSKNMKLCTSCGYCAYKTDCWKDANDGKGLRTFIYSTGPVFLVNVVDVPRVLEI
jgi:hypothetical protein